MQRYQVLRAGVTRHEIATRLRDGRLTELHRGVYLVGAVPTPHAHEMAAVLACGPGAVLSHRSAAALWGLLSYPATAPVWITTRPGRGATRSGITAVRAHLDRQDLRRRLGIAVTSPPRTVFDLASQLRGDELEQLIAEANYRGLAREAELRVQVARNAGCRGVSALREALDLPGGPMRTRSEAEKVLLHLLRRHGFEGFETNAQVLGYEVDFLWRDVDFAVEVDGWDGHSGRPAFERDRLKLARLSAGGVHVMPVTGRQLRRDGAGVLARLRAALDQARRAITSAGRSESRG